MHRYFALYIGVIPIPVGWFFKEHEAKIWAHEHYPAVPHIDIRPFEFRWPADSFDDHRRPNVFLVTADT